MTGLELKGHYSLQQQSMIYQLLRTDSPTITQFENLSPFIAPEDFKIIIRKLPEDKTPFPSNVLKIYGFLKEQEWNQITKFMTLSGIATIYASKNEDKSHGQIANSLYWLCPKACPKRS